MQYAVLLCHDIPSLEVNEAGLFTYDPLEGFVPVQPGRLDPGNLHLCFKLPQGGEGTGVAHGRLLKHVSKHGAKDLKQIRALAKSWDAPIPTRRFDVCLEKQAGRLFVSLGPVVESPETTLRYCDLKNRRMALVGLLASAGSMLLGDAYIRFHSERLERPDEVSDEQLLKDRQWLEKLTAPKATHAKPEAALGKGPRKAKQETGREAGMSGETALSQPMNSETAATLPETGTSHSERVGGRLYSDAVNRVIGPLEVATAAAAGGAAIQQLTKKPVPFSDVAAADESGVAQGDSRNHWQDFVISVRRQITPQAADGLDR